MFKQRDMTLDFAADLYAKLKNHYIKVTVTVAEYDIETFTDNIPLNNCVSYRKWKINWVANNENMEDFYKLSFIEFLMVFKINIVG